MKIPRESLKDKHALVTGAGSGIGKAAAKVFAYAGARVALLGRTADELNNTLEEIGGASAGHLMLTADVRDSGAMQRAAEEIRSRWNRLEIVVANAGINGAWASLEDLQPEEWDETLEINLRGTFFTVKYPLPLLKARGGSVIVISSVNGNRMFSNTGATAYSCSKAAQVAFTKMAALELARYRVRVNAVCPGAIETKIDDSTEARELESLGTPVEFPEGQVPLTQGDPGTAGQVAELIWFLASDLSTHVTGTEIYIDGGQSLLQG